MPTASSSSIGHLCLFLHGSARKANYVSCIRQPGAGGKRDAEEVTLQCTDAESGTEGKGTSA